MNAVPNGIEDGVPLNALDNQANLGKLYFQTKFISTDLPASLTSDKADNQILGIVHALQKTDAERTVVLVSKDINMRIKARALGINSEDYFNDQVSQDGDLMHTGQLALPENFWDKHSKGLESWQESGTTFYRLSGPMVEQMSINQFVYLDITDATPFNAIVTDVSNQTATLRTLTDYSNPKHGVWGIGARNREQNFALNILMDPNIDFVTLLGQAGTGKTLVTIAAALQQTLEMGRFSEVIITRITVPVGEDIGFLPGTEEEKMTPWMGALQDNLEILIKGDANAGEWARAATNELIKNKVKIKAMSFMRGRTFVNKLLVLDEAQNLTPKQMKTLITRAGPGTKVVCLGNLAQIDTPYLTEGSSGLAYVVEHFKNWPHSAHITLMRGERSRLADHANEVL
jgi:PhoH-like ATPase